MSSEMDVPDHSPGRRIAQRMNAMGMGQSELARRIGVKQPTIHQLIYKPGRSSKHLHKVASALKTSPEYLLEETDDPAPSGVVLGSARHVRTILLPVTLPNADTLVEAFRSILLLGDLPMDDMDSLARVLAEEFPAALEGALFRQGQRRKPGGRGPNPPSPEARDNK